jgi:hypothetical protein
LELLLLRWTLVLPELLRLIAWETRTITASRLGSTDLALVILHLLTLPLYHDCSVKQVLECREGVIHQLILERVNQASQEMVLSLGVGVDIFKSIARQLQKPVPVLTDRRWPLLEGQELLLLHCHQTGRNMVLTKASSELFPGDGVGVGMGGEIRLPPWLGCSSQQMRTIQDFLPVITLSGMQLPLHSALLVFSIHGVKSEQTLVDDLSWILYACLWASEASKAEVVAVAAAAEWRPESDQWLELPESASGTSARWTSGAGAAAAAARVPHPAEVPAPAEHTFLLCACFLTSAECNHTLELILQILQHKKRV